MAEPNIDPQILNINVRLEAVEAAVNKSKETANNVEKTLITDSKDNLQPDKDVADKIHRLTLALADLMAVKLTSDEPKATDAISTEPESESIAIPQLNRVNWTQFKNSVVGETQSYTIDVLIGPVKSRRQRRQVELSLQRDGSDGSTLSQRLSNSTLDQTAGIPILDNSAASNERSEAQIEMPERIRINCEKLLVTLSDIVESSIGPEPVVLLRPYKLLVRHDEGIRQRLRELEMQHRDAVQETLQQDNSVKHSHDGAIDNQEAPKNNSSMAQSDRKKISVDLEESQTEIDGLKCLVEFIDTYITPVYQRYRSSTSKQKRIQFRDLWYLYRPGDLVVTRKNIDESKGKELESATGDQAPTSQLPRKGPDSKNKELDGATGDQAPSNQSLRKGPPAIWRVLSVSRGRPDLDHLHGGMSRSRVSSPKVNDFSILCYAIAYNGITFGPIQHTFDIVSFEGQKEISTLDPCPVRYVKGYAEIEARLVDRGKEFVRYTRPTHCLYVGLTLSELQLGYRCEVSEKNTTIDGPVMVDFKEAKLENGYWVTALELPSADEGSSTEMNEDYPRSIWKDKAHRVLEKTEPDTIYDDDYVDAADMDDFVASNTFLTVFKNSSSKDRIDHRDFGRVEFALLPDRVVGFDFYRRKFGILALDCLHPVRINKEGWDDLKLPRGHKHMVQAQIRTHFLKKQSRQNRTIQDVDADLVRGKGLGLIVLLHGAPGVGKTSTAECVAATLGRPLYPITCGDLGDTAETVENTLARTFAKAEAWDCVLLLDEADVFLAQRTRTDLKRNAIVSVFLRVLEYYKGTLILTTNRVGAFDEAFKSRIHLQLYYPALNKDQTLAIWKVNLDRILRQKQGRMTAEIQEIQHFAEVLFDRQQKSNTRWNGRQIRNAFHTALAMAEYEALEEAGLAGDWEESAMLENVQSRLKMAHFEAVAEASSQFDMYIEETTGGTDAKRAFTDRDRADHFRFMVPTNAPNHYQNAQWSMGAQGAHTQMGLDPFTPQASRVRQSGYYDWQESASMQASLHQSHASPSSKQAWTEMGAAPGQPPQEAEMPHRYLPHGTEPPTWKQKPDNGECGFRNLSYGHSDGAPPQTLSTSLGHDLRPVVHRPITPITPQRKDEDGY